MRDQGVEHCKNIGKMYVMGVWWLLYGYLIRDLKALLQAHDSLSYHVLVKIYWSKGRLIHAIKKNTCKKNMPTN